MTGGHAVVVIGVGNEYRADDGAGPVVLGMLRDAVPGGVPLVPSDGEPTRLLEAWTGAATAIVIDAVAGGDAPPGTLHRLVVASDAGPASQTAVPVLMASELARQWRWAVRLTGCRAS